MMKKYSIDKTQMIEQCKIQSSVIVKEKKE